MRVGNGRHDLQSPGRCKMYARRRWPGARLSLSPLALLPLLRMLHVTRSVTTFFLNFASLLWDLLASWTCDRECELASFDNNLTWNNLVTLHEGPYLIGL
jgi:hypothetical protein